MLTVGLTAKAIQRCAAALEGSVVPVLATYAITVQAGAALSCQPVARADAEATVRDLMTLGADFDAGPLAISGRDFATNGVTPASVFDARARAHIDDDASGTPVDGAPTVSNVAALIRRAFGARITDTIRPMNASYGARHSWHKFGQAIDFVPAGGVTSINRDQIRGLMGQGNVRLIELLGPGDRGHSNHWHVAFARPGQIIDRTRPVEKDEDWIVDVASADAPASAPVGTDAHAAPPAVLQTAAKAPPQWDVFASAEWRASQGGGS